MRPVIYNNVSALAFVIVGAVQVLCLPGSACAVEILDDPIQIDERVSQLVQTSNSLSWELYRYHQQQPDYAESYRAVKQLWTDASQIQADLRSGPVETESLQQKVVGMNQTFAQVAATLSKWGPGDQSSVPATSGTVQREVVAPGVGIDVPFVGIRIGGPDVVVTTDATPKLERRRLHPNAHGSKRSLERELESVRVSLDDLAEDAGVTIDDQTAAAPVTKDTVAPPAPNPEPEVVKSRSTKK